jgi:hypothetical protein
LVETDKHEFKRKYPNLAEELELEKGLFEIVNVDGAHVVERKNKDPFAGYVPTAIDYLRRCNNEIQAEETINYLEKKGEITSEYANQLRKTLREKGVRSFGPKKEDDYYFKKAGYG